MTDLFLALVIFLVPLAWSPGPGNTLFAALGARFGLAASLPVSTGYHAATWLVTVAIGLGFAGILTRLPQLFTVIGWAGSAYVLWLAWAFLRAGAAGSPREARPAGVGDGVLLLLLNPKAYVIIALMFAQFLDPGAADPTGPVLFIATVFTLNNLVAFTVWTAAGGLLGRLFGAARQARVLNTGFAAALAGVAIWMLPV
jgi:threonine/homoserine/homoserine lactone efflux protein